MVETFCTDGELGYVTHRTQFESGRGFALDESYRLAHLPLVVPNHPRVIANKIGTTYNMGRHEYTVSLVLPIPDVLHESREYRELEVDLGASPFASKIAWNVLERRRSRLHATICGALPSGQWLATMDASRRDDLVRLGSITIELRGLFSGTLNRGRLYLKVYPERCADGNPIRRIQRMVGCRETDLYLVGLFNLTDDLTPQEASALAALLERWWDKPILRLKIDQLWLLGAYDDLVLDAHVVDTISFI